MIYTLHVNKISETVEIRKNFTVDYNQSLANKDYNNNGVWGKIINPGIVVKAMRYNPNRWKGEGSFPEVNSIMNGELINLKNLPVS